MDIANVLKALRTDSELTQHELSERINIAQATIACYENGQRVPYISSLVAYADFFDCSIDYLVGRCDEFGNRTGDAEKPAAPERLSDEERGILQKYRRLSKEQRVKLSGYMDGLSDKV